MRYILVLLLILLLVTVFFALLYRPPEQVGVPEVPRAFREVSCSRAGVVPTSIEVNQGEVLVLNLTSEDEEYVFDIPTYGQSQRVPAGETATLRFQATLPGTFTYVCRGAGAPTVAQRGDLTVVPPG